MPKPIFLKISLLYVKTGMRFCSTAKFSITKESNDVYLIVYDRYYAVCYNRLRQSKIVEYCMIIWYCYKQSNAQRRRDVVLLTETNPALINFTIDMPDFKF